VFDLQSVLVGFSTALSKEFLILRIILQDSTINVQGRHIKHALFLSDFKEN